MLAVSQIPHQGMNFIMGLTKTEYNLPIFENPGASRPTFTC